MIAVTVLTVPACAQNMNENNEVIMNNILPLLEEYISQTLDEEKYAGAVIAVVSRDQIHYLKTFGVKRLGKPAQVTPNTLFQVGSISKTITATLVALLQKKNILKTNDTVHQYLPNFQLKHARTPLKVWHLLNHSSGVSGRGFNTSIEEYMPRAEILRKLQDKPLKGEPGHAYSYNNAMFSVMEDVMQSATGNSYHDLLTKNLLTPLGMNTVSTTLDAMQASPDRAHPHVKNKEGRYVPAKTYSRAYYAVASAGGINASVNDLIPFIQLHLGKYPELLNDQDLTPFYQALIQDEEAAEWLQDGVHEITEVYYGLGWRLMTFEGERVIFHGGWLKGFINFLAFLPDHDVGIIVLQNTESKFAREIAFKFFDLYVQNLRAAK